MGVGTEDRNRGHEGGHGDCKSLKRMPLTRENGDDLSPLATAGRMRCKPAGKKEEDEDAAKLYCIEKNVST